MRVFIFVVLFPVILFSCEDPLSINDNEVPQKTIENSLDLFSGSVIEKTLDNLEGIQLWKVKIKNNDGAVLSIYWERSYGQIYRVVGEKGPYSYELNLPLDVIVFSTARFLAFESSGSELVLENWKLIRDPKHNSSWVFQFFLKDQSEPVSLNATTGDKL